MHQCTDICPMGNRRVSISQMCFPELLWSQRAMSVAVNPVQHFHCYVYTLREAQPNFPVSFTLCIVLLAKMKRQEVEIIMN